MTAHPSSVRIAALLLVVPLGGCGGGADVGGSGGGGDGPGPSGATFVAPNGSLELPLGTDLGVRVQGLPPGTLLRVVLDTDGDPATTGDAHPLGPLFVATASGELDLTLPTANAPLGEHRLLALRGAGVERLATAPGTVRLVRRGDVTFVGGPAAETATEIVALPNGRVVLLGTLAGPATYQTLAGRVDLDGAAPSQGLLVVVDGDRLASAREIGGATLETLTDLAAGPGETHSVAGSFATGRIDVGSPVVAPSDPLSPSQDAAFLATFGAPGTTNVLAWAGVGRPAQGTAVTHAPDGSRWRALRAVESVTVGVTRVDVPPPHVGTVIVRLDASGTPHPPYPTVLGFADVTALELDAAGHLVVAGQGTGMVQFGTSFSRAFDRPTAFVARFAANGTCLGVLTPSGGTGYTEFRGMDVGPDGTVFLAGWTFAGPTSFGALELAPRLGGSDGFVLALTPDLSPRWIRPWTWDGNPALSPRVICEGVVGLPGGGCVAVGGTTTAARIEGRPVGGFDALDSTAAVVRYGADGALEWLVAVGGGSNQELKDVAQATDGSLVIAGHTFDALELIDRDGALHGRPSVHAGSSDAFVLRLDLDGRVR